MKNYNLQQFKWVIEQIELTSNDNLGIILHQNKDGKNCLALYEDAKDSLGIESMLLLTGIFISLSEGNYHTENSREYAGSASTKRNLLDYLNIHYIMYKGSDPLKYMVNEIITVFKDDDFYTVDQYLDRVSKSCLMRSLRYREYKKAISVSKNKMAVNYLISKLYKNDSRKEYDIKLFKDFKKNFKPYKPMNDAS